MSITHTKKVVYNADEMHIVTSEFMALFANFIPSEACFGF
jgi:hypothetical protein